MLALPVVLNEVLYDPSGADGGFQFVEIINRSPLPVALAGWHIDAGDGAAPDRWRTWWTGAAADVLLPGARFVVGEGRVVPLPDRIVPIELENGPDAVRLVAPDGGADVLGYGALTFATLFEGRPAADVAAGFSLARTSDGVDTDDNAADWSALSPPTPGAANRSERDLAVDRLVASAERIEPGDVVTVEATVANRGVLALPAHEGEARLWAASLAEPLPVVPPGEDPFVVLTGDSLVARVALAELEPGDSVVVHLAFAPPAAGAWRLTAAATAPEDGAPANDRRPAIVQVGPGTLVFSEVNAAPEDGPEWVELANRSAAAVTLDGWTLEDATGRRGRLTVGAPGGAFALEPESLVVVTSDPAALASKYPKLDPQHVVACTPWPSLNNDAPSGTPPGTAADRIVLRPPDGRAADALDLPPATTGRTRERRSLARPTRDPSNWSDSAVRGGTPARANSVAGGAAGPGLALTVAPAAHVRGAAPVLLSWATGLERARVTLALYDLRGRRVRLLVDEDDAPGAAGVAWDGDDDAGRPAPPGLYVVGLTARAPGSVAFARTRAWVSVE